MCPGNTADVTMRARRMLARRQARQASCAEGLQP
jgi:hypothetical protein